MEPPIKKAKSVLSDVEHVRRLMCSLQEFNVQENFIDLCFVCARGHKVYAHKLLLCTVSSLLKKMILEIPDNFQMITIHLPDVESRLLSLVVSFLYEGSVRVNKNEYTNFQNLMNMLGIVLAPPNKEPVIQTPNPSQPPAPPAPSPHQLQPPQLVYVQTPNSQGQVQYMVAAPTTLGQGSIMGMSPIASTQTSAQPLIMNPNTGQLIQAGSQVQQNNIVQVVQPSGSQVVQCASQMVVQGSQQTIMANNNMQVGIQNQNIPVAQSNYTNQSTQQQPQYALPPTASQLTSPRRQFRQTGSTIVQAKIEPHQQQLQARVTNHPARGRRLTRVPQLITQNRFGAALNRSTQRRQVPPSSLGVSR